MDRCVCIERVQEGETTVRGFDFSAETTTVQERLEYRHAIKNEGQKAG